MAAGFVGGAGNAWMNGASFGNGLMAGLQGGIAGGITGGLIGGVTGGIKAHKMGLGFWDAGIDVDISKGAMHTVYKNGTKVMNLDVMTENVRAKYVGYFEDTKVFESKALTSKEYIRGVTLPGKGIIVGKGVYTNRFNNIQCLDLLKHEYGHILQAKQWGNYAYYDVIGPESLNSQMMDGILGHDHDFFWTETHANYHANYYFNNGVSWNGGFNVQEYPIQALSLENYIKLDNSRSIGRTLGFD